MGAVRVLGVDPGLTRCGIGVVQGSIGRQLELVGVGVVRTPADQDHAHRLLAIETGQTFGGFEKSKYRSSGNST